MAPKLVFGTATFGASMTEFQDVEQVKDLLKTLKSLGIEELDTAARYPPMNFGRSEELIGLAQEVSSTFAVDSKVLADVRTDGSGELSHDAVQKSVAASCDRLQRPNGLNILYAHRPDPATPLKEQIQAMNEQIRAGHCQAWGVSNTPPALLQEILELCDGNGWHKPTCYQGTYNVFTRGMERELLPILRAHNMAHYAFQILGAGFLTGKYVNNNHKDTRLDESNPLSKVILDKFGFGEMKDTMKQFDEDIKAEGLSSIEVALRWIAHHSALGEQDGMILGASKRSQVIDTVELICKGPLPDQVLEIIERTEAIVKDSRSHLI